MNRRMTLSILVFIVLLSSGCRRRGEEIGSIEQETLTVPSQEGWNSELVISESGRIQAVVRYGHMLKFDELSRVTFDEGVEVDFYDIDGNRTSHLTSDRGQYDEDTEDVFGEGHVIVVSDSGLTLHTHALRWNNRGAKIISDTTVMVTTQNQDTLYGVGFESNPDLTHWTIRDPWGIGKRSLDIEQLESSIIDPSEEAASDSSHLRDRPDA